ncbi:MAG TPA: hypothetical protein VNX68_12885 [Nitrosopumilaceae archaeon]|jgi:hypothetical protein|nr:hypothetical protein [Nitrosopumilaceae archaeon]
MKTNKIEPQVIPSREDVRSYFKLRGVQTDITADDWFDHYTEKEWKDASGNPIKYWMKYADYKINDYLTFIKKYRSVTNIKPEDE